MEPIRAISLPKVLDSDISSLASAVYSPTKVLAAANWKEPPMTNTLSYTTEWSGQIGHSSGDTRRHRCHAGPRFVGMSR